MSTSTTLTPNDFILDREEVYDAVRLNIWCFKHVDDIVEGITLNLCNMTSCYPFEVEGIRWRSSEELYLVGEFSNDSAEHLSIQNELRAAADAFGVVPIVS